MVLKWLCIHRWLIIIIHFSGKISVSFFLGRDLEVWRCLPMSMLNISVVRWFYDSVSLLLSNNSDESRWILYLLNPVEQHIHTLFIRLFHKSSFSFIALLMKGLHWLLSNYSFPVDSLKFGVQFSRTWNKSLSVFEPVYVLSDSSVKSIFSPTLYVPQKSNSESVKECFQELFSSLFQDLALFLQAKFLG